MGLKVGCCADYKVNLGYDKIRPKWDWKDILHCQCVGILPQIKSDQNGIERNVDNEQRREQ